MGIKKQSDGRFKVSYSKRHPKTRVPVSRTRTGVKNKAEAKRVYNTLVILVDAEIKKTQVPKWSEYFEQYIKKIDQQGELYKSTIYKRDKVLKKHVHLIWGERLIDEISTQDIRELINTILGDKSASHKKFVLKAVRSIFDSALEDGFVIRNPTPRMKFKIADKIMAVLKEDQIIKLLRRAQELDWDWYPHYAVALYTGLRSGEMYALNWDKVDFKDRQILVDCAWSSKDGIKSTKSGDDRKVEIPGPLVPILKELYLERENDSASVLPRFHKWTQGEQARELRMFLRSIGLPEVRFHDLRASWATLLLSKGVAPSKVMSMGGWKKMETMMIYMRKAGIDIRGATSCLDDMEFHGVNEANVVNLR